MSIDTASKRRSTANVSSPWRSVLPLPSGIVGDGQRPVMVYLYAMPVSDDVLPSLTFVAMACGSVFSYASGPENVFNAMFAGNVFTVLGQ